MTTIRTTCPRCGEVDMGPEAILLSVARGGREGSYRFVCPVCADPVEKPADRKIVALLVSAGVDVRDRGREGEKATALLPGMGEEEDDLGDDEPTWLERHEGGPAFTIDDVIQFHFLLQDDRQVERFLS
jgi:hypothetical protein